MPAATAAPTRTAPRAQRDGLRCRVRLADGRVFAGALAPERHRALQLGILHEHTDGLVELAAGARRDGRLQITTRRRADHFLPGGQAGGDGWLRGAARARRRGTPTRGEEVFLAPAVRAARARRQARGQRDPVPVGRRRPARPAAGAVGVPRRAAVPPAGRERRRRAASTPTGSSTEPLPATRVIEATGELVEPIERAHLRLDPPPRHRRGRQAERRRPGVRGALAGDAPGRHGQRQDRRARADPRGRPRAARLPDRAARRRPARPDPAGRAPRPASPATSPDPYKRISPPEYFERLAGIVVPRDGLVSLPGRRARGPQPVVLGRAPDPSQGWCCHAGGCGARGAIYDLASVLLGGPWGRELRGEAFKRARAYVADVFGELRDQPTTSEGVRTMRRHDHRVTRRRASRTSARR